MTERVIDRIRGAASGPTLIVIGGVHGNEPAGVEAARVVAERVRSAGEVRGELVALRGNIRALAAKRRFLARDLNRLWTPDRVSAARAATADPFTTPTLDGAELSELAELADELDRVVAAARGPVVALDLHTTSSAGHAFGVIGASPAHRALASQFPIPIIVGLEELLDGVLTRYLSSKGCLTLAVEGGQTETPTAFANLTAVVAIAAAASGVCAEVGGLADARAVLTEARGDLPPLIEVVSRHAVLPEHGFVMEPGFANLHRTAAGTLLAHDRDGELRAPFDGFVLLPLYQPQGSDGFFYGRELAAS